MKILFLCVANSARSQLAEGLAKFLLNEKTQIQSAGSMPSGIVHPWAIQSLMEIGIDIHQNSSKSFHQIPQDFLSDLDFVITLCAEEICPVMITKAKRLHWPIQDPANSSKDQIPEAFRSARDEIQKKLLAFGKEHHLLKTDSL